MRNNERGTWVAAFSLAYTEQHTVWPLLSAEAVPSRGINNPEENIGVLPEKNKGRELGRKPVDLRQ